MSLTVLVGVVPKGNGEPLKDAQQGSDIITFVFFLFFFFFLKDMLTAGLWQLKNKREEVLRSEVHRSL